MKLSCLHLLFFPSGSAITWLLDVTSSQRVQGLSSTVLPCLVNVFRYALVSQSDVEARPQFALQTTSSQVLPTLTHTHETEPPGGRLLALVIRHVMLVSRSMRPARFRPLVIASGILLAALASESRDNASSCTARGEPSPSIRNGDVHGNH